MGAFSSNICLSDGQHFFQLACESLFGSRDATRTSFVLGQSTCNVAVRWLDRDCNCATLSVRCWGGGVMFCLGWRVRGRGGILRRLGTASIQGRGRVRHSRHALREYNRQACIQYHRQTYPSTGKVPRS